MHTICVVYTAILHTCARVQRKVYSVHCTVYSVFRLGRTARSPSAGLPKAPAHTLQIHPRLLETSAFFSHLGERVDELTSTAEFNDNIMLVQIDKSLFLKIKKVFLVGLKWHSKVKEL